MVAGASFVHFLEFVNAILVLFSNFVNRHLLSAGCVKFWEASHAHYQIDAVVH